MSRMLTFTILRKWVRYPACDTCGAFAGEPCTRFPPPSKVAPPFNEKPHRGRVRAKTTCKLWGGGSAPCAMAAGHGGLWHCDHAGRRTRIRPEVVM